MNTIQGAVEKTETQQCVEDLAVAWHDGYYTDEQAENTAELQDMNFIDLKLARSRLFEGETA